MNNDFFLDQMCERYPRLIIVKDSVRKAARMITDCYSGGGKLLVCGNGGSSADSDHIVGEMMKSFENKRPLDKKIRKSLIKISGTRGAYLEKNLEKGFPAISLSAHTALTTSICNDMDPSLVFAQQVVAFGKENDVLIGISTSGNSQNIIDASITAKAMKMSVIGLTGKTGGKMKQYCDMMIAVPEKSTACIQELHLPILHTLCRIVEDFFFSQPK